MPSRAPYLLAAAILLAIEAGIALFIDGGLVRDTLGDVLVVILLYCALMGLAPMRPAPAAALCLLFAVAVETAQAFDVVERLGLEDLRAARIVIGTTFSWTDLAAYAVGCGLCLGGERLFRRRWR